MTLDLPFAERRLKSTARLMHQSMWLLFLIAAGLMVAVRRSGTVRAGSVWVLSAAVLIFMLSFVLRDVVRIISHRNTEDKLVKEVKNFLQREPVWPVAQAAPAAAAVTEPATRPEEEPVPCRAADFIQPKGARPCVQEPDLAVFDAIPAHDSMGVRSNFYPVLLPIMPNC